MKYLNKIFLLSALTLFTLAACDKKDNLSTFGAGVNSVLSSSSASVAPAPADSNNVALTLTWTSPEYTTDTATYKFIIEMDSTGKNFSKPTSKTVTGSLKTTYLAKELNSMLLARNYAFNVPVDMDVRMTSSYSNNNEKRISNIVKVRMTPYKIPPKVALPTTSKLYIVGGATQGDWTNPVPTPTQEFSRLDETTWAGVFNLKANGSYLLLPENGQWTKFGGTGSNNSNNVNGDNFKAEGGDLLAPATAGWYKIVVDFQFGKFTVTPYDGNLPTDLFIVGDATPGGWTNPVPLPSQKFTRVNSSLFELTLNMTADKSYLFLPVNGDWSAKYGGMGNNNTNNVNGDDFKYNGGDMKAPATTANYKITVNYAASSVAGASGKFTLVKQ